MTVEKNKHLHACDRKKIAKVFFVSFHFCDTQGGDVKIVFGEFSYDVNIEIVMSAMKAWIILGIFIEFYARVTRESERQSLKSKFNESVQKNMLTVI